MMPDARWRQFLVMAGTVLVLTGAVLDAGAEGQRFTLDDMMKLEAFGNATIDPDGRWLVFERIRPYDAFGDYSFRTYAAGKSGHQLWRYDLSSDGAPERLPGIDPNPHSYIQEFSPSGAALLVMQYRFGDLRLAAYDMARERFVVFSPIPAISRAGEHNPVWISDEEVVYAALPAGSLPPDTSIRVFSGKHLSRSWEEAWKGQVATASEVRTPASDGALIPLEGNLVRVQAETGDVEKLAAGLFVDLRVSPDRRWLAGLAAFEPMASHPEMMVDANQRQHRLSLFDLGSGKQTTLAPDLDIYPYTITWAPAGDRLAVFGWRTGEQPEDGRFHIVDPVTGAVIRLEHCGLDLASERERGWQPRPERAVFLDDGLAVFARHTGQTGECAARFSAQDYKPASLGRTDWYLVRADVPAVNLTRNIPQVSAIPVDAGPGQLTVSAPSGLYRLHANGSVEHLTPDLPGRFKVHVPGTFATRSSVIRPEFTGEALVSVTDDTATMVMLPQLRGGSVSRTSRAELIARGDRPLAVSVRTGVTVYQSDDRAGSSLHVVKAGTPGTREIARINTHLNNVAFGQWVPVAYSVQDAAQESGKRRVESCVLMPAGAVPGARVPVIVDVYPGSQPDCQSPLSLAPRVDPHSPELWAGLGYAYARIALPQDLVRTPEGPIAGMDELVEAAVDAFVSAGIADPERLALTGLSQGGVSALYVAAKSDSFRAVIAKNSFADLASHYFGSAGIYAVSDGAFIGIEAIRYDAERGSDFGMGATPFSRPELFLRNSPVFLAPDIQAPVLLIHSDMDAFSLSQFDEMFGALKRAGKVARYVRYWGEGHGPSSPANMRDMWMRQLDFLQDNGVQPD